MMGRLPRRLLALLARLPFRWLQGAGGALGWLTARFPNAHRAIAARNLALCFPELTASQRRRLLTTTMVESGKTLTETLALWLGPCERLAGLVKEVRGEEPLRAALEAGRGAILCSPHLGSWEMIGLYMGPRHPMITLYRPPRRESLDEFIREARGRTGARIAPIDTGGIRTLYQSLREGSLIGMLPDQDPRDPKSPFAPFFGVQANTMTLVARLAARSGAPVFFAFAERLPRGEGFRLHIRPAPEGITDPDPVRAAATLNAEVESCVRLAPAQYQWSYKRFRTRPAGERPIY